ncbi:MAG: SEC-C metal-binding domain-containing protein [Actinomycetota bacterium]|nr:SEC-C metal-binding domain-containing protein [Actinomycetota bacterium]
MNKRRRGFPQRSPCQRGDVVHGDKELLERLGRNDPCPCGSGRRFQAVLYDRRAVGWLTA